MADLFADIHCHPLLKYIQADIVDLWEPIGRPNPLGVRFTAADMKNMAQGEVQIACVALVPPEQKTLFFQGPVSEKILEEASAFISRIPKDKIQFYQTEGYDHYHLLIKERQFYVGGQGITARIRLGSTSRRTRCRYQIARSYADIEQILTANRNNNDERIIAIVFTIESTHALGCGHLDFGGHANAFNVDEELMLKRVDALKGIGSPEVAAWQHPPIWITMTHAFNNDICGHAQALSGILKDILDYAEPFGDAKPPPRYQKGINTGLTPLGRKVIERLLGIDEVSRSRPDAGKRILADIKHMSTRSRQEYYALLDAHLAANPTDVIPVVMSHAAVNGKPSLDDQGFNPQDRDSEWKDTEGFNPWSINLYDDEILRIHRTKGLIGLIFFEPLLGGKKRRKAKLTWDQEDWAELFADQIEHVVRAVYQTGVVDKREIWDRICIGSDFDGQLNPTDRFATSDEFPNFKKNLKRHLNRERFDPYREAIEVDQLADKICFENVNNFLKRHF